ncbi:hypothetical protein LX32DRAFT_304962 [Colletotrichum zoysiae]|uniref:Uncharacterized protein n=1 Tax=Colletotrichum zoysiae TaxID=1216348 RepID=A0AAD9LSZ6_9PEZI|nr:hypothetical protein LX32DRAFT_304962 [Colletotrichum zoysiae]
MAMAMEIAMANGNQTTRAGCHGSQRYASIRRSQFHRWQRSLPPGSDCHVYTPPPPPPVAPARASNNNNEHQPERRATDLHACIAYVCIRVLFEQLCGVACGVASMRLACIVSYSASRRSSVLVSLLLAGCRCRRCLSLVYLGSYGGRRRSSNEGRTSQRDVPR